MIPEEGSQPIATVPPRPWARIRPGARSFAELTTTGVGGTFDGLIEAESEADIIEAFTDADARGIPTVMLGGGSNLLADDVHFPGLVIRDKRQEITLTQIGGCEGANVKVTAGCPWELFVVHAIEQEWIGAEALSGIPGSVGGAAVQNIGAYGQEVSAIVAKVNTWDRLRRERKQFAYAELGYRYRSSVLKQSESPRYIVLSVEFQMRLGSLGDPIAYPGLAAHLGAKVGERVPSAAVREAVLEIRGSKGMVLNDADRDTYSTGSFFTNPVVTPEQAARLPEDAPRYEAEGGVKLSAAWLIQHAGFLPGFGDLERAHLSTKHTLALVNGGKATASDIRDLARQVRRGVREAFDVTLEPEPILVGRALS